MPGKATRERDDRSGELVEFGPTQTLSTRPAQTRTEDYVTGKFG